MQAQDEYISIAKEPAMLNMAQAQIILTAALTEARSKAMNPLAIAVLDGRGALKTFAAEDKTSLKRGEIAIGKAHGAVALGVGSRTIGKMALDRPHFIAAAGQTISGPLIPVAGGVLIRDADGLIIGAVGVSGDTSDNDEIAAIAGIIAAGLKADPGA
jgi:uncharacterized protein GlcG (DUF336 family)